MINPEPLVSVVTPVFNGDRYFSECIESVLAQAYQNWEYIIVNNCSTDETLKIAQSYADKDKRIRIVNNEHFVGVIENHNIAFSQISHQSKYCKVVSADDWIYPECLSKMVALAEAHPTIGIVGAYQLSGENNVRWKGLPENKNIIKGHEVCRANLLNHYDVSGDPTSSLYRSDLVRQNNQFFRHLLPFADTSAFYEYLQNTDFGFIHDILSIERIHNVQVSSKAYDMGMSRIAYLSVLINYGPIYLNEHELGTRKKDALTIYWKWLGSCLFKLKGPKFWSFHIFQMKELKHPIQWHKVILGAIDEIIEELHQPTVAIGKFINVIKSKF